MNTVLTGLKRGDLVLARGADGEHRELRALTGEVAGGDFPVVWVCGKREWETAEAEGREPQGIPFPAEDVSLDG
jgi:hypothetical protein